MKRFAVALALSLTLGSAAGVAQDALQQARDDGKSFGKAKRADPSIMPSDGHLDQVPGYTGTDQPQGTYFEDPDRLATDGAVQATGNEAFQTVTDQGGTRPAFSNDETLETTARATQIEQNPGAYLGGEVLGGSSGACVPLPPGAGQKGYYEATCNQGAKIGQTQQSCSGRIVASVVSTLRYFYYGVPANQTSYGFASNAVLNAKVAAGLCRVEPVSKHICDAQVEMGAGGSDVAGYLRFCRGRISGTAQQYSCASQIPQGEIPEHTNFATGTSYLKTEGSNSVTVTRNEGTCPALAADTSCVAQGPEVCTEGPETRIIDGVPVTQTCWAWSREFMCQRVTQATDCTDLEANKQCKFLRDECLDDPQSGACKVLQRVFSCPLPDDQAPGDKQYICGDDVYCLNGNCETIEREASTEFKDAVVALNALDQAGKEFDPNNLTVFSGERETCSKKIFGASNCCSGKGVPLLTPWLCSSVEKQLDEKDDKGLCYKVGSYCADSILGVCVTSKDAHCCFGSKISRILQEQGRPQIGKPWGKPKDEQCKGFTIQEFQQLDLSKMDFAEVYAEFTEAAKLPDEVQTMTDIQKKIQDYYDLHAGQ